MNETNHNNGGECDLGESVHTKPLRVHTQVLLLARSPLVSVHTKLFLTLSAATMATP